MGEEKVGEGVGVVSVMFGHDCIEKLLSSKFLLLPSSKTIIKSQLNIATLETGYDSDIIDSIFFHEKYLCSEWWNEVFFAMGVFKGIKWLSKRVLPSNFTIYSWLENLRRNEGLDVKDLSCFRLILFLKVCAALSLKALFPPSSSFFLFPPLSLSSPSLPSSPLPSKEPSGREGGEEEILQSLYEVLLMRGEVSKSSSKSSNKYRVEEKGEKQDLLNFLLLYPFSLLPSPSPKMEKIVEKIVKQAVKLILSQLSSLDKEKSETIDNSPFLVDVLYSLSTKRLLTDNYLTLFFKTLSSNSPDQNVSCYSFSLLFGRILNLHFLSRDLHFRWFLNSLSSPSPSSPPPLSSPSSSSPHSSLSSLSLSSLTSDALLSYSLSLDPPPSSPLSTDTRRQIENFKFTSGLLDEKTARKYHNELVELLCDSSVEVRDASFEYVSKLGENSIFANWKELEKKCLIDGLSHVQRIARVATQNLSSVLQNGEELGMGGANSMVGGDPSHLSLLKLSHKHLSLIRSKLLAGVHSHPRALFFLFLGESQGKHDTHHSLFSHLSPLSLHDSLPNSLLKEAFSSLSNVGVDIPSKQKELLHHRHLSLILSFLSSSPKHPLPSSSNSVPSTSVDSLNANNFNDINSEYKKQEGEGRRESDSLISIPVEADSKSKNSLKEPISQDLSDNNNNNSDNGSSLRGNSVISLLNKGEKEGEVVKRELIGGMVMFGSSKEKVEEVLVELARTNSVTLTRLISHLLLNLPKPLFLSSLLSLFSSASPSSPLPSSPPPSLPPSSSSSFLNFSALSTLSLPGSALRGALSPNLSSLRLFWLHSLYSLFLSLSRFTLLPLLSGEGGEEVLLRKMVESAQVREFLSNSSPLPSGRGGEREEKEELRMRLMGLSLLQTLYWGREESTFSPIRVREVLHFERSLLLSLFRNLLQTKLEKGKTNGLELRVVMRELQLVCTCLSPSHPSSTLPPPHSLPSQADVQLLEEHGEALCDFLVELLSFPSKLKQVTKDLIVQVLKVMEKLGKVECTRKWLGEKAERLVEGLVKYQGSTHLSKLFTELLSLLSPLSLSCINRLLSVVVDKVNIKIRSFASCLLVFNSLSSPLLRAHILSSLFSSLSSLFSLLPPQQQKKEKEKEGEREEERKRKMIHQKEQVLEQVPEQVPEQAPEQTHQQEMKEEQEEQTQEELKEEESKEGKEERESEEEEGVKHSAYYEAECRVRVVSELIGGSLEKGEEVELEWRELNVLSNFLFIHLPNSSHSLSRTDHKLLRNPSSFEVRPSYKPESNDKQLDDQFWKNTKLLVLEIFKNQAKGSVAFINVVYRYLESQVYVLRVAARRALLKMISTLTPTLSSLQPKTPFTPPSASSTVFSGVSSSFIDPHIFFVSSLPLQKEGGESSQEEAANSARPGEDKKESLSGENNIKVGLSEQVEELIEELFSRLKIEEVEHVKVEVMRLMMGMLKVFKQVSVEMLKKYDKISLLLKSDPNKTVKIYCMKLIERLLENEMVKEDHVYCKGLVEELMYHIDANNAKVKVKLLQILSKHTDKITEYQRTILRIFNKQPESLAVKLETLILLTKLGGEASGPYLSNQSSQNYSQSLNKISTKSFDEEFNEDKQIIQSCLPYIELLKTGDTEILNKLSDVFVMLGHQLAVITPVILSKLEATPQLSQKQVFNLKKKLAQFVLKYTEPSLITFNDVNSSLIILFKQRDEEILQIAIELLSKTQFVPIDLFISLLFGVSDDTSYFLPPSFHKFFVILIKVLSSLGFNTPSKVPQLLKGISLVVKKYELQNCNLLWNSFVWRILGTRWKKFIALK